MERCPNHLKCNFSAFIHFDLLICSFGGDHFAGAMASETARLRASDSKNII